MIIYDRWGQRIFESKDLNTGWDGTFKNASSQIGAYVYLLKYRDVKGIEKSMREVQLHLKGKIKLKEAKNLFDEA